MAQRGAPRARNLPSLRVGGHVSTPTVDAALVEMASFGLSARTVLVDLTEAESFDVVALQQLLSAVAARDRKRLETCFRLPIGPAARHQLRQWRFPTAVSAVTGMPFRLLVVPEDYSYFGEAWPTDPLSGAADSPRSSVHAYLTSQRCFGLRPYELKDSLTRRHMLESEVAHWGGHALSRLLEHILCGPAADVLRVLVQELVSGALQRTGAQTAVIGAQLELPGTAGGTGTLTISEWDDGGLRADMLSKQIWTGPRGTDRFVVRREGRDAEETYHAQHPPRQDGGDAEMLLASLIASNPRDRGAVGDGEGSHRMYTLYKCAVDTFQGSLRIDSGRHRLRIRAAGGGGSRYEVDLTSGVPPQNGCLFSVQLPVHDG
ncbi:MAG: hypothetical protein HOZ81_30265 [Streptomyces sp.]|nr:hypothetical protein [Streptomyces sp.]NUT25136.1 hypothetical protein [Streptomyces sp.]